MLRHTASSGRHVGEAWTVWDGLRVENGAWRGRLLADLARQDPLALLGSRLAGGLALFPLLVKFVDTQGILSVQVHPDDAYAWRREGQPFGKAEVWVVVDAAPGACLFHGVKRALSRSEAEQAVAAGSFQETLEPLEVAPGDVILNNAGTVHALGAGLLLYELQQSCDLTYRLYDWNRNDPSRPLHLEKALDVATLVPCARHKIEPVEVQEPGATRSYLCACRHFAVERLWVRALHLERPAGLCFHILTLLEGSGRVVPKNGPAMPLRLEAGDSLLVPAAVHEYEIRAEESPLVLLKAYVPDLVGDVAIPLRERGIAEERIAQLAGDPARLPPDTSP